MVTIRNFNKQDATRLVELLDCEEVSRWTSNIPFPYTLNDAHSWLAGTTRQPDRHPYAVEYENLLVACVSWWPFAESEYEVGYWVGKEYWGKNIASSALSLFIKHDAFPKCNRIVAKVMSGNIGSEKVLLKNGFTFVDFCEIRKRGSILEGRFFEKVIASQR